MASAKYNHLFIISSRMMPIVSLLESSLLYSIREKKIAQDGGGVGGNSGFPTQLIHL